MGLKLDGEATYELALSWGAGQMPRIHPRLLGGQGAVSSNLPAALPSLIRDDQASRSHHHPR